MARMRRKEWEGQRGKDGEESLCFRLGRKGQQRKDGPARKGLFGKEGKGSEERMARQGMLGKDSKDRVANQYRE